MGAAAFALTVAAATLSYYLLEQPLLRLRDRGSRSG
jgi:peptidoglycan/LPS O-acetylase OafA/YrhL